MNFCIFVTNMPNKPVKKVGEKTAPATTRKFLLTDGCMWELNKKNGTYRPHAIEVVDVETGQVRYIKSGSIIVLIEGIITNGRSQDTYNKQQTT